MSEAPSAAPGHRLPDDVKPLEYAVWLEPNLQAGTFSGRVDIRLSVVRSTARIVLHARELSIQTLRLSRDQGRVTVAQTWRLLPEQEWLQIDLAEAVTVPADLTLGIEYEGVLNDQLRGFYRTAQEGGRVGAVCHFEATGARQALPCWDEPTFRARFQINLTVEPSLTALSNMPEKSRTPAPSGSKVCVAFEPTPSVPTYLVCWSVGDYEYVQDTAVDNVAVRVYTPLGQKDQGAFALEVAVKALRYYKEFFGIPYQLPKMDLIALADFPIGAMENWGLLTFRERCLLFDAQGSSAFTKQKVAIIVAHEVAHQWFGNLVTVEWWTHLWLKEGYATWIEYLCVDHLFPEWNSWTQFITGTLNPALELDCLRHSHPVEVEVQHPAQIDEIFDLISYYKGASIIRMLFNWIGETNFRQGMKAYLERHSYGNATTEDLWAALGETSGHPVAEVMSMWTKKKGYPLIHASLGESKNELIVRQSPFHMETGQDGVQEDAGALWSIPLSLTTKMSPKHPTMSIMLKKESEVVFLTESNSRDWFNVNPGKIGYFRVHYSPELMRRFVSAIEDKSLPIQDRIGLIQDFTELTQAGICSSVDLLHLIERYRNDDDYTVWEALDSSVSRLCGMVQADAECLASFNHWRRWLFQPAMQKLGLDPQPDESHLDMLFRSLLHWNLVHALDTDTLSDGLERFEAHRSGSAVIPADLRTSMYGCALHLKGQEIFEGLIQMARDTNSHEEKAHVYSSLGCSEDANILQQGLEYGLSPAVRSQDSKAVLGAISSSSVQGRNLCWSFFKANATEIGKRYKTGGLLTMLIKSVTNSFSTVEEAFEIEAFFESHPFPGARRSINQAVESVRLRAQWIERDHDSVKTYLMEFQKKEAGQAPK
eukprot:snap_masked-scaffold699_size109694-processed-gene-0.3 protein:Tk03214 transcript:snap_masked-scaffold699_size109694-processed-gene-0.3-mRNA-1 annotation:"GE21157"